MVQFTWRLLYFQIDQIKWALLCYQYYCQIKLWILEFNCLKEERDSIGTACTVGVMGSGAPVKISMRFTNLMKKFTTMLPRHQLFNPSEPHLNSHWSDTEIMRISTLHHSSVSGWAIAHQVRCGDTTVHHVLNTYDYKTFNSRDKMWITKWKTINREDRILTRTAKIHDDQVYRDIIYISDIKVSRNTLHRHLKEIDLYSQIHHQKPKLQPGHEAVCLRWARKISNINDTRLKTSHLVWWKFNCNRMKIMTPTIHLKIWSCTIDKALWWDN